MNPLALDLADANHHDTANSCSRFLLTRPGCCATNRAPGASFFDGVTHDK